VSDKINKSDEEWREQLTEEQYHVTRKHGTERAFSGRLDKHYDAGTYLCICCATPLFSMRQISAKMLMKAFLCAAPRFIVTVVTRILAMCFPMGRNPPAFAIASIRRHWIL